MTDLRSLNYLHDLHDLPTDALHALAAHYLEATQSRVQDRTTRGGARWDNTPH